MFNSEFQMLGRETLWMRQPSLTSVETCWLHFPGPLLLQGDPWTAKWRVGGGQRKATGSWHCKVGIAFLVGASVPLPSDDAHCES